MDALERLGGDEERFKEKWGMFPDDAPNHKNGKRGSAEKGGQVFTLADDSAAKPFGSKTHNRKGHQNTLAKNMDGLYAILKRRVSASFSSNLKNGASAAESTNKTPLAIINRMLPGNE